MNLEELESMYKNFNYSHKEDEWKFENGESSVEIILHKDVDIEELLTDEDFILFLHNHFKKDK